MKRFATAIYLLCTLFVISCSNAGNDANKTGDTTAATNSEIKTNADSVSSAATNAAPMDSAAMMKAWMDYMTPGENHKILASHAGTWTADVTSWMTPDAPPQTSKATSTSKMIMGGRYEEARFKGSMMGQPFEGVGITGYDNAKKKFVSTWVDNMGTGVMNMEGDYDAGAKTLSLSGKFLDPTTGKECTMREVITYVDDKNQKWEMYTTPAGGKEYKTMEMIVKKKG